PAHHWRHAVAAGIETAGVVSERDLSISRHAQEMTGRTEITQIYVISVFPVRASATLVGKSAGGVDRFDGLAEVARPSGASPARPARGSQGCPLGRPAARARTAPPSAEWDIALPFGHPPAGRGHPPSQSAFQYDILAGMPA